MSKSKVALVIFAEHRDDFFKKREQLFKHYGDLVKDKLSSLAELVTFDCVRSLPQVRESAAAARAAGCESAIFSFPIWSTPTFAVVEANLLEMPILLLANKEVETSSLPGLLGAAGGLSQIGIAHKRVWGDIEDEKIIGEIKAFISAAHAIKAMRGTRYGIFGGRSLGIYTAGIDPSQWQKLFGVDVEHIDQWQIVQAAEKIEEEQVLKFGEWLVSNGMKLELNDALFRKEHLAKQIRSYLATKKIISDLGLDFVSIKCQQDMSNGYCVQCLNIALLNDPYDHRGAKKPLPCACEGDGDAALSMMLLNLLSGGKPTTLMDIKMAFPDEGLLLVNNCGGMATYFAARTQNPYDNLKKVRMMPHVFGEAGGGTTQFIFGEGPLTFARFCRKDGRYTLTYFTGTCVEKRQDLVQRSTPCFPHAVVETDIDIAAFVQSYSSNHIHAVEGDFRKELAEYCRIMEIESIAL